jgi:hypothetical protein
MSDYPEHDKLSAVAEQTQAIGEFIEFVEAKGIFLARYEDGHNFPCEVHGWRDLLAEWAGIDQRKLEAEKRQMLASIRTANGGS